MKKTFLSLMIGAACMASCTDERLPQHESLLSLTVNASSSEATKTPVEGSYLPGGSSIGLTVTDASGTAYDGQTISNIRCTATGEGASQSWTPAQKVMLTSTEATVYAYHPYQETASGSKIAVTATSEVQDDWMWATPAKARNSSPKVDLTMNHALTLLRVVMTRGDYTGTGQVSSLTISSPAMATAATLDITSGALSEVSGANSQFSPAFAQYALIAEGNNHDVMAVPTGTAGKVSITAVIDGLTYQTQTDAMTLAAGKIATVTLKINKAEMVLSSVKVNTWTSGGSTSGTMANPAMPKITISGGYSDLDIEKSYSDGVYTVKAKAKKVGYSPYEISVKGTATSSQSVDGDGVRTVRLSDIKSDITLGFQGAKFMEWARIQHVDGTLYTADEWLAAETAGTVTDADANGVAVRYSKSAVCPHMIYPKDATEKMKWSSNTSVIVPGLQIFSNNSISDVNGKDNTETILAAVDAGTIADAPAAQYCDGVIFAGGQKGYLPAAGEVRAWIDNKTAINACMDAIEGDSLTQTWTSTQESTDKSIFAALSSNITYGVTKSNYNEVRAVSVFSYDQADEYSNR